MASRISVSIVGRTYEIACDEGQEQYVSSLAAEVDRRAGELLRAVGTVGDARLLLMVALLFADENNDLRRRQTFEQNKLDAADAAFASGIEAIARRIEAVAVALERG